MFLFIIIFDWIYKLPPVRKGKKVKPLIEEANNNDKDGEKSKKVKIKSYDYDAWSKFDVVSSQCHSIYLFCSLIFLGPQDPRTGLIYNVDKYLSGWFFRATSKFSLNFLIAQSIKKFKENLEVAWKNQRPHSVVDCG